VSLRERLEADMKEALKSRDRLRLETVRGVRGAVRNKEIEVGGALDDAAIQRVIRTLTKQRGEAIEQFRAAGRTELVEKESAELAILEAYLPAAPDAAQIEAVVREVIAELGARGPSDTGKVMRPALDRLGPAADGKLVNQTVRRLLSALGG
jgi:uncharacterized protein YqeY